MLNFGFYNMDCIEGMRRFPDKYFDLAIVDPIYGDVTKGQYMSESVNGKYMAANQKAVEKVYHKEVFRQPKTDRSYFEELFRVSNNQIVWGGNYFTESINKDSQCWVVWDKEKPDTITFSSVELAWTSFDRAARIFRYKWNGFLQADMRHKELRIHPTQKPVALYKWLLDQFAKPGDKILDTHVGSGSSLIACYERGFDYVGFEIDKTYYEQAQKRIEQETAQMVLTL